MNLQFLQKIKMITYMYGPIMISVKTSILLLYLRLFSPRKSVRIWIYAGIAASVIIHMSGTIAYATMCRTKLPYCGNKLLDAGLVLLVASIVEIISDFYILLIPLFVISNLPMPSTRKVLVAAVFCTGLG